MKDNVLKEVWGAKFEILFALFLIALLLQLFNVIDLFQLIGLTGNQNISPGVVE